MNKTCANNSLSVIPTKAMLLCGQNAPQFTATVFEKRKPSRAGKNNKKPNLNPTDDHVDNAEEFDIRKARNEVLKFGLSGFQAVEKEKAQVAMAIKLGAKPPKREYKNYKKLQEEQKQEKESQAAEESFKSLGKKASGEALLSLKKFSKKTRKRRKDDSGAMLKEYGTISTEKLATIKRKK
ncbi:hypothetical protein DMENIID0001_080270 [Sergentomyia squamirostris]